MSPLRTSFLTPTLGRLSQAPLGRGLAKPLLSTEVCRARLVVGWDGGGGAESEDVSEQADRSRRGLLPSPPGCPNRTKTEP